MYVLYVCNNAPTYYIHVTYRQTSSQPSIRPSMYIHTFVHTCICLFVCTCVSLSLPSFQYAGVPFGRHILICSLYAYSRPVTKALKILPANNKLKLANTHNFCYMYMCMCANTHTHIQTNTCIHMYVFSETHERVWKFYNGQVGISMRTCVCKYIHTYTQAYRQFGNADTNICTSVRAHI